MSEETKSENVKKPGVFSKPWVQSLSGVVVVVALLIGVLTYKTLASRVAIDLSTISAPEIAIGPEQAGVLQSVNVKAGDMVTPGEAVAQVGAEVLSAQVAGLVIDVQNVPGQVFSPGQAVVTMVEPQDLRVVGTIDENKGLSKLKVGDPAYFTVDAFGSERFVGVVDEISPTANQTGVAFSISDQRPTNQFDVKVRYDTTKYSYLRNGMSARLYVYPTH
jgi:multidrug resistance efflux pump